jgi:ferredoxin
VRYDGEVDETLRHQAERAMAGCPERAISLVVD